jgi:hypothetical protein
MDRAMLREHLKYAELHVDEGERRIKRQVAVATDLDRAGHAELAEQAWTLLRKITELQALHVAHRDSLKRQLADDPSN